jgi:hypothetical protein
VLKHAFRPRVSKLELKEKCESIFIGFIGRASRAQLLNVDRRFVMIRFINLKMVLCRLLIMLNFQIGKGSYGTVYKGYILYLRA